jgi:hypothetical protein
MCVQIKRHWYCLRVNIKGAGERHILVHSCKGRKSKRHRPAATWYARGEHLELRRKP